MMPHIPGQEELEGFDWKGARKDTVAAKARPGDFVFPVELAQDNPLVIAAMKLAIAQSGADPNAYVAGSEAGNYNPLNDQQHFFLKKAAKKLKKTVKKVAKPVKKGWDKVRKSPIGSAVMNVAAPIAGFAIGGPAGAALASGAAAKATGASTKNALLMGAVSGLTMGAASKFGGVSAGKGNLFQKMGNTAKGMTTWGKTGVGKAANVGGKLVSSALKRPAVTAGVIGAGAAALAARNAPKQTAVQPAVQPAGPTAGQAYQANHNRQMQSYGQFMGNQGAQQSNQFYNQMFADQTARQQQMLNQSMNMGQRAVQLPPNFRPIQGGHYLPGQRVA
jgi:hypothetical protein